MTYIGHNASLTCAALYRRLLAKLKCGLSYGCNSSPKVREVGRLRGNFRLKPLRDRELIALPTVSINSYYHGAHEQITVLPVAMVTGSGGKLL